MTCTYIGKIARELLFLSKAATVWGMTSRGIFIHLEAGWIVFLSSEKYRGPLTLNMVEDLRDFTGIQTGQAVTIEADQLKLTDLRSPISFRYATHWAIPPIPGELLPQAQRQERIRMVTKMVLDANHPGELRGVFERIAGIATEKGNGDSLVEYIDRIRLAMQSGDCEGALLPAEQLLGRGAGLTPQGDDLLMGIILTFSRYSSCFQPIKGLSTFQSDILERAPGKTTTLSANLLQCATQGEADERLIGAFDGLLTGSLGVEDCASALLSWGATSGSAALAGFDLAVSILDQRT